MPTRKGRAAALKAWKKRRILKLWDAASAMEAASKTALENYLTKDGWEVAYFQGPTGRPRNGIIDGVAFRLRRGKPDVLELQLLQVKGGRAGVTGGEIRRLRAAASSVNVKATIAAFDRKSLEVVDV